MSTFDIITDSPGLLRVEALNMSIKFDRTSETTGRISWNIPTPAAGCTSDSLQYCGILVTVGTQRSTYQQSPENGRLYNSDPTVDPNLFAGDMLGQSFVVGQFYQDRTTTFFDISGLQPDTPYFVTGYPIDCQQQYFVEGIHNYSQQFTNRGTDGTHGTQVVQINSTTKQGIKPTDGTGLVPSVDYKFSIQVGVVPTANRPVAETECGPYVTRYNISIDGSDALTYQDLVNQLNKQFAIQLNCVQGPYPPNAQSFWLDLVSQKLYQFDGTNYTEQNVIISTNRPDVVNTGDYWFDNQYLYIFIDNQWVKLNVITLSFDPTKPIADKTYWFDHTTAYLYNGTTWCPVPTIIQTTDPSIAIVPNNGSYWYNDDVMYKWDYQLSMWVIIPAIISKYDPSTPNQTSPNQTYWFNNTNNVVSIRENNQWVTCNNVTINDNPPLLPGPDKLWFNSKTKVLCKRNDDNTDWVEVDLIIFPVDPTLRQFCNLWFDSTNNVLYSWDGINNQWKIVSDFYNQQTDPSDTPVLDNNTAWFNPNTNQLKIWNTVCWVEVEYIDSLTDPLQLPDQTYWYDSTNKKWYIRINNQWVEIVPIISKDNPTNLPIPTYWFNPTNKGLYGWNGISWVSVGYNSKPQYPVNGQCWYDSSTNTLKQWSNGKWVNGTPPVTVQIDCNGNLLFTDTTVGSTSFIEITDDNLFKSLDAENKIIDPDPGTDGASDVPSYKMYGVGTDGSDAIRSELANEIRYELGYPVMTVELTKEQIDYAITKSLSVLRTASSICYKREFFFMHIKKDEQVYYLTNKIQGMQKIVDILGVYRMNSAFLSSAHGAGVYGQIVMQHMYNMGTFDLLSFHLMGEYTSLMERLFATRIVFNWNEQTRGLMIFQRFSMSEPVVMIEASCERTEQDIMSDRYARTWIRNYALAVCRIMLSEIRGKYSTLPGAGGSVTLNAAELRQAGQDQIDRCMKEIDDYIVNKPDEFGVGCDIVFG